jgi:hypothetical protein
MSTLSQKLATEKGHHRHHTTMHLRGWCFQSNLLVSASNVVISWPIAWRTGRISTRLGGCHLQLSELAAHFATHLMYLPHHTLAVVCLANLKAVDISICCFTDQH